MQAATAKKYLLIGNITTGSTALPTQTVISYVHTGANLCRNSFTAKEVAAFNHPMQYQAMHISRAIPGIIVCLMAGDRYGAKINFHHMASTFGIAKNNFHYMAGACGMTKKDFHYMSGACGAVHSRFYRIGGGANEGY